MNEGGIGIGDSFGDWVTVGPGVWSPGSGVRVGDWRVEPVRVRNRIRECEM